MKCVQRRSFFWSECGKIRTKNNSVFGYFSRSEVYPNNSVIGYLNINSLKVKNICLRDIISTSKIDILCINETELGTSFPNSQLKIDGYQFPLFRKDWDSKVGGKIVFVREGIAAKRLSYCESPSIEAICIELTISKRKCCILFAYCLPNFYKARST